MVAPHLHHTNGSTTPGLDPGIFKMGKTIPQIVVEVTRMLYIPMHWVQSQHSTSFFKYLIPTLFSFFFLSVSVFHSIFFPLPSPFLKKLNNKVSDILLTSPFFFLIPFFFSSFFSFFFFLLLPPSFIPLLFYSFFYASFLLGMSDQPFEMSGTF